MKRTKYKGVMQPNVRPLHLREIPLKIRKGMLPSSKTDQEDDDLNDLEPDYVRKYLKRKRQRVITQLKLWGNPYDPNY